MRRVRPGQTDADDTAPYETLAAILTEYPDGTVSSRALSAKHAVATETVLSRVSLVEFKRRQTSPALRIIQKSLDRGWKYPITAMHGPGTPDS